MRDIQFQGIVAVGNTQSQAVFEYRKLAMGKGATCFVDRDNNSAFVSNAGSDLENTFNPTNGNLDLEQSTDILNGLQFEAQAGDVHEAFHFACTAGCGIHLVYDSLSLVQHCPVCSTAVASDDADEGSADDEDEEILDDESTEDTSDEDESEDDSEDDESLSADDESDEDTDEDDSDDSDDAEADEEAADDEALDEEDDAEIDDEESDEDTDADDADDEGDDDVNTADEPLVVAASSRDEAIAQYSKIRGQNMTATASSVVSVEYKVCASAEGCGAHIVSEIPQDECPRNGCGAQLMEPVEASDDEEIEDEEELDLPEDDSDLDLDDEEDDSEDDSDDEESDEEEEGDDVSMNLLDDDTSESSDGTTPPADDASTEGQDDTAQTGDETKPADDNAAPTEGQGDNPAPAADNTSESSDDEESDDEDGELIEVDALEELPDDASADDLDVSFSAAVAGQPVWTAFHKGSPIAVATASSINPDHKPFFGTPRFGAATVAAVKQGGAAMLSQLGFKGVKASLRVSKHVDTRIAALASDQKAQLDQANAQHEEALEAALATAAIGLNRGFFEGKSNPLRETLLQALASTGMRNPEVVVDNALRSSFEPLLRSMFAIAKDNLSKPAEVQESLAKTIMGMSYQPQVATASSQSGFETRLGSVGTVATASSAVQTSQSAPAKTETAVAAAGSDPLKRINDTVSLLGRR